MTVVVRLKYQAIFNCLILMRTHTSFRVITRAREFILKFLKKCLKGGVTEKEIFHLLVQSRNGATARNGRGQSHGPGTPLWSPMWVAGAQVLKTILCCSPICISRQVNQKWSSWGSILCSNVGCWSLNLLCCNIHPRHQVV